MAEEDHAIGPSQGQAAPVQQDNLRATLPIDRYILINSTNPYLDFDGYPLQGKQQDGSNHNIIGLLSPPIPSPPMNSLHASALRTTTQAIPHFAAPQEIDHNTAYSLSTFGNEAWISPLDVAGAWQLGAPLGEQVAAPVFDQFPQGYFPASYVDIDAVRENNIMDPETVNGESAHPALMEETETLSRTPNPHEQSSPVGRAGSPRRKSNCTSSAPSPTNMSRQPDQFLSDLGPIENGTTLSTNAPQASRTLEFIPYRDTREDESQKDNALSNELGSASAGAQATGPSSSLVPASPLSSTMAHSSLAHLELYNARARNRVSASRCRIKQKASMAKLKEAEKIMMDERERLLEMKKLLTDQVCGLKELLFMHARCKEDRLIGEYLELTATRIVEKAREAAEQTETRGHIGHFHPSPRSPEELDDDSYAE